MRIRDAWPLLVALGLIAVASAIAEMASAQPAELPARVVTLGGRAEVWKKGTPAWADAALRDDVGEGDGVRTLAGRLTLRTTSGQTVRLGPRTQVFLAQSDQNAEGPTRLRMDGGRLWLSALPNQPPMARMELQAGPVTVIGRDGGASVAMNPDGSVLVGVSHGAFRCLGTGWQRSLVQGQQLTVTAAGAPLEVAKLKRDKADADWIKWNEQQDLAGGYSAPRAER